MGQMVMPRDRVRAVAVHGAVRVLRKIPPFRAYLEDLKIKPLNTFKKGLFVAGRRKTKLQRGAQFPQSLVKQGETIRLSDDVLGEQLTMVGLGVDPQILLEESTRARWQALGGHFLHIGMRGQPANTESPFVESFSNDFVLNKPRGWLVVVRPDRVVMHDGTPDDANRMVTKCLEFMA